MVSIRNISISRVSGLIIKRFIRERLMRAEVHDKIYIVQVFEKVHQADDMLVIHGLLNADLSL